MNIIYQKIKFYSLINVYNFFYLIFYRIEFNFTQENYFELSELVQLIELPVFISKIAILFFF